MLTKGRKLVQPSNYMVMQPAQPQGQYTTMVDITPEIASQMLKSNTTNRRLNPVAVQKFAKTMSKMQWHDEHHQGIAFDEDGNLIDGQHRLCAICVSGVTVRMRVHRNVPAEQMVTIDCGRPRTLQNQLAAAGVAVTQRKTSIIRNMIGGFRGPVAADGVAFVELLDKYGVYADMAIELMPSSKRVGTPLTQGIVARVLRHFEERNTPATILSKMHERLEECCFMLHTSQVQDHRHLYVIMLRDRLQADANKNEKTRQSRYLLTQRVFEAFVNDENLKQLKHGKPREAFALISDKEYAPNDSN